MSLLVRCASGSVWCPKCSMSSSICLIRTAFDVHQPLFDAQCSTCCVMHTVFDVHHPLFYAQSGRCGPAYDAHDALIYKSSGNIGGPGLLRASHRRMLDCSGLISSCNPGWLRSTPCHNHRPGGCLWGVDRLVQDTIAGKGVAFCVLID